MAYTTFWPPVFALLTGWTQFVMLMQVVTSPDRKYVRNPEPEPAPALLAAIHTLSITPSHVHFAIDSFASMPPSLASSTFLPSPVRLAMEDQLEPDWVWTEASSQFRR
ncbi:hypothetical protein EDB85DRAFT_1929160 [Lactarius pseudohatsudake]|nr:hypothetical protein EDB85DRAFT_1929160 [Lactarius pseudohatsudake]